MRHYYYNEELGETRWERPPVMKPGVVVDHLPRIRAATSWQAEATIADGLGGASRGGEEASHQFVIPQLPMLSAQGRGNKVPRPKQQRVDPAEESFDWTEGRAELVPEAPLSAPPASARRAPPRAPRQRQRQHVPANMSAVAHIGRKMPFGLTAKLESSRDDPHVHARARVFRIELRAERGSAHLEQNVQDVAKWEPDERRRLLQQRAGEQEALLRRAAQRHADILHGEETRRREQAGLDPPPPLLSARSLESRHQSDEGGPRGDARDRSASMFVHARRQSTVAALANLGASEMIQTERGRARLLAAEIRRMSRI